MLLLAQGVWPTGFGGADEWPHQGGQGSLNEVPGKEAPLGLPSPASQLGWAKGDQVSTAQPGSGTF